MSKQIDATFLLMHEYSCGVSKGGLPYIKVDAGAAKEGDELVIRIARPDLVDMTGLSPRAALRANGNSIYTHFDIKVIGRVTGLGQAYMESTGDEPAAVQRAYYVLSEAKA